LWRSTLPFRQHRQKRREKGASTTNKYISLADKGSGFSAIDIADINEAEVGVLLNPSKQAGNRQTAQNQLLSIYLLAEDIDIANTQS
jgi:hypothetical protein